MRVELRRRIEEDGVSVTRGALLIPESREESEILDALFSGQPKDDSVIGLTDADGDMHFVCIDALSVRADDDRATFTVTDESLFDRFAVAVLSGVVPGVEVYDGYKISDGLCGSIVKLACDIAEKAVAERHCRLAIKAEVAR